MSATPWPDAGSYAVAARDGEAFFADTELRGGRLRTSPLGIPLPATGRNAVVFRLTIDDMSYAVRCFTNPPSEGRRRYDALRAYVARHPVPAIADARWIDDAVSVGDRPFPMIRMEWVEGRNLDDYVAAHVTDPERMRGLADGWTELLERLENADIAHGDLQHGNVLVEADGRLRLVDLDGVWTPASTDLVPSEVGHRNYQHPQRVAEGYWSRSVDAFSALVIAVSLEALCQRPSLWDDHNDGANNLILTEADFLEPCETVVWKELAALGDPLPALLDRLDRACRADVARLVPPVELIRSDGAVTRRAPPSFLVDALRAGTEVPDAGGDAAGAEQVDTPVPGDSEPVAEFVAEDPAIDRRTTGAGRLSPVVFVVLVTFAAILLVIVGAAVVGTAVVP